MRRLRLHQGNGFQSNRSHNTLANSTGSTANNMNSMDSVRMNDPFDLDFSGHGISHRLDPSSYPRTSGSPPAANNFALGYSQRGSSRGKQAVTAQLQTFGNLIPSPVPTPMPMETFLAIQAASGSMPMPMPTAGSASHATPQGGVDPPPPFIRPPYIDLNANRVSPAGPRAHPDPNFRPIGTNNWTEILYDHTLLQYLTNSNIKEIKDHVGFLSGGVNPTGMGPVPITGGPYNTDDATTVWKYCDAYMKRRGQERNNRAARRSRARKESETLHWKTIALAAGAMDRDFEYDAADPAYGEGLLGEVEGGGVLGLPRETLVAITAMRARWDAEWAAMTSGVGGTSSQLAVPRLPPPGFGPGRHPDS